VGPDSIRLRLDIAYDGTAFGGWAAQPKQRTVQGQLQDALATVLRTPAPLTVAGRTDAGVHATGQVAHVDVAAQVWDEVGASLVRRLASVLPPDIRVRGIRPVAAEFDARFSALWRRYEYRLSDAPAGVDPVRRGFVVGWRRPLDVPAMARAAAALVGEHDFAAYCRRRPVATTVRTLQALDVRRHDDEIVFTVQADAFCHAMVRSLVGALLAVGEGRRAEDWPASLLSSQSRANDVSVAAAHGLVLVAVGYPPDDQLRARAQVTRQRRLPSP
jgi:tRNA pseudouridine38-40 synthase